MHPIEQSTMNDPLDGSRFLDYFRQKGVPFYDTLPDGWVINERATTAPTGYVWINNRVSIFSPEYRHALMKRPKKQPQQLTLW